MASIIFCAVLSLSCERTSSLPPSAGEVAEVVVVCSKKLWQALEPSLRKHTNQAFEGLPRIEPVWSVVHVTPSQFNQIFRSSHSIAIISQDTINRIRYRRNVWSKLQLVVNISVKTATHAARLFDRKFQRIHAKFHRFHTTRIQSRQFDVEPRSELQALAHHIGKASISIPKGFHLAQQKENFFWYKRDGAKNTQSLVAYAFDIPEYFSGSVDQWLLKQRDAHLKSIEGTLPGTYLATEWAYTPYFKHTVLDQHKVLVEVRGLWKMESDFMGGPFLSYFVIDDVGKRVSVFEGFVYAPEAAKRNHMIYLEAILKMIYGEEKP